ncbi:MAG: GntR family transcriptional regulator, partial [Lachnospiraceae bacterium]
MRSDLIRTEKETLSEVAYRYLKEQIISGVIREGDVITENNIGRALGMSRTPVKKALTQLESENYVRCLD